MESTSPNNIIDHLNDMTGVLESICKFVFRHRWQEFLGEAYICAAARAPRFDPTRGVTLEQFLRWVLPNELRRAAYGRGTQKARFQATMKNASEVAVENRRGDVTPLDSAPSTEPDPIDAAEFKDDVERLHRAIRGLPRRYRQYAEDQLWGLTISEQMILRDISQEGVWFRRRKTHELLRYSLKDEK